jgi:hypothetical protein
MKSLINLILLLFAFVSYSQTFTLVEINAKWNQSNKVDLPKIENVKTIYTYLEDQKKEIQERIKAVPVIILYKDNKPVKQWTANLSFKLNLTKEEIEYAIRENKQTYQRSGSN